MKSTTSSVCYNDSNCGGTTRKPNRRAIKGMIGIMFIFGFILLSVRFYSRFYQSFTNNPFIIPITTTTNNITTLQIDDYDNNNNKTSNNLQNLIKLYNKKQISNNNIEDDIVDDELIQLLVSNDQFVTRFLYYYNQKQLQSTNNTGRQQQQEQYDNDDVNQTYHSLVVNTNHNNSTKEPDDNVSRNHNFSTMDIHQDDLYDDSYHEARDHVHIMYALSGKAHGFLEEFTMSLKSVLLNAPIFSNLTIHILADEDAYTVLYNIINTTTTIQTLITYHQITIQMHNIQARIHQWERFIPLVMKFPLDRSIRTHTIGAFFRLFAHKIVIQTNPTIKHLLYMDTDVMIMANLEKIWQYTRQDTMKDKLFIWGNEQCSGFVILNVPRMHTIWELAKNIDLVSLSKQINQKPDDQLIFRSINITYPNEIGIIDDVWDVTVAGKIGRLWSYNITSKRPYGVGMLHFNGGKDSKSNAFITSNFIINDRFKNNWGIADYYVRIPWNWVKFIIESYNVRHNNNNNNNNNNRSNEGNYSDNNKNDKNNLNHKDNNMGFPIMIHQYAPTA